MIRKLAGAIRQYWLAALLSPLCMVGEVYMEVRIPGIIATIVDKGIEVGNIDVVFYFLNSIILRYIIKTVK